MKKPPIFKEEKPKRAWNEEGQSLVFFERLRVLLALAGRPRFRLLLWAPDFTVRLAVGRAVSMGVEIAVDLLRFSLWNVLTSLQRCWIAEAGSQVFSSSRKSFQEIR